MQNKETFILSLWIKEGATNDLRGMLQNVKSGEKRSFASTEQLLALLSAGLKQTGLISNKNDAKAENDE